MDQEPPPPYPNHTLTASPHVNSPMHLYYDPGYLSNRKAMYFLDTILSSTPEVEVYHVSYPQTPGVARMHIHRGDENGPTIAEVFCAAEAGMDYDVEILWQDSRRLLIENVSNDQAMLKVKLDNRDFFWTRNKQIDTIKKTVRKGLGDVELIDQHGQAAAIFVNEWTDVEVDGKKVGNLTLLGESLINRTLTDQLVVSLLALVERYQFMRSARHKEWQENAIVAGALLCIVS